MPNITVTVSESSYRAARVWAAHNNTSVSAVVQYCIERQPNLRIAQRDADATARRSRSSASAAHPAGRSEEPSNQEHENPGCETVKPTPVE
jgi:hypothetical protein